MKKAINIIILSIGNTSKIVTNIATNDNIIITINITSQCVLNMLYLKNYIYIY